MACYAGTASAQITPAAGYTPLDDTPSLNVGATIFADDTRTMSPEATDVDGSTLTPSSFNASRTYVNGTGNISHADADVKNADRNRAIGQPTFEHQYVNAGFEYLKATDQMNFAPALPKPQKVAIHALVNF